MSELYTNVWNLDSYSVKLFFYYQRLFTGPMYDQFMIADKLIDTPPPPPCNPNLHPK